MSLVARFADVETKHTAVVLTATVDGRDHRETYDAAAKKMLGLMKQVRLWDKETATKFNESFEEIVKDGFKAEPVPKVKKDKPVDPKKDLLKRFRAAKRAAKFYAGMMDEMQGMNRFRGGGQYAQLLKLWSQDGAVTGYPWTPPTKDYVLPKTEEEFQAEYDAAFKEFDAVMVEGNASGVVTDSPREQEKQTVPEVLSDDCPTENLAPEIVDTLEHRKKNMAAGFEGGLIPDDGIGEEPTEEQL